MAEAEPSQHDAAPAATRGRAAKLVVGAAVVALAVAAVLHGDALLSALRPEAVAGLLEAAGAAAPLVFVAIMAAVVVIAPLPSLPLDIAAGHAFGWLAGGLLAATGATLGASLAFSLARWLGRDTVRRLVGGHATFCSGCSEAALTGVVFASRLVPFVSFDAVSYGAGLTAMRLSRFCAATFLGTLPLTFLYTSAGAALEHDLQLALWLVLPVMLAVFLLPRALERLGVPLGRWAHGEGDRPPASRAERHRRRPPGRG